MFAISHISFPFFDSIHRIEVEEEIRKQVDELMRQELKNLKMVSEYIHPFSCNERNFFVSSNSCALHLHAVLVLLLHNLKHLPLTSIYIHYLFFHFIFQAVDREKGGKKGKKGKKSGKKSGKKVSAKSFFLFEFEETLPRLKKKTNKNKLMHSKFYVHVKKSVTISELQVKRLRVACYKFWRVENAIEHFRDRTHTAVRNI